MTEEKFGGIAVQNTTIALIAHDGKKEEYDDRATSKNPENIMGGETRQHDARAVATRLTATDSTRGDDGSRGRRRAKPAGGI